MFEAITLLGDSEGIDTSGLSAALGAVPRWGFQQVAAIPGVRIAVDADLLEKGALAGLVADGGGERRAPLAEQLACLYLKEGLGFIEKLEGAFSIALWDEKLERLILAIDRFGIQGMYWRQEGPRLLFASRAGAIRSAQMTPAGIDTAAVMQFLLFSVVPAPLTIWQGTRKLEPGRYLLFEKGGIRESQYWDLGYPEGSGSEEEWAEGLREAMRAAVHRHLEGCDPQRTGAYLSGGTDSSSVTAFMSDRFAPVNTFSITFPEDRYDEAGFAHATAERFRTRHHEMRVQPADAWEAIPRIVEYYDEPFGNASAIGSYYCARLARENGVDVLLAGDGGDELFAGNKRYATDKYFQLYHRVPRWLRRGLLEPAAGLLPRNGGKLSLPARYIRRANIPNPRRIYSYGVFQGLRPEQVFENDFLRQAPPSDWMTVAEAHFQRPQARSELNRLMYLDLKLILADNDLRKVTGTAELAGIRARFPLLDHRLAEFSGRIPARLKLRRFEKRYIFKQAMRGILPDRVLYKKKHGFGVPLGHWMLRDSKLNSLMQDVFHDSRTRQRGYFRPEFFDRIAQLHSREHPAFYGEIVWYVLSLELWHRSHLESARKEDLAV